MPPASAAAVALASAVSGALSRLPSHPLDTLKTRMQASAQPLGPTLRLLLQQEGVMGLYRGFLFTAAFSVPASCLYFTTYELVKGESSLSHFASGMLAETVSCILWVPCDVVKERMQVQRFSPLNGGYGEYSNGLGALRYIARTEGLQRGLYRGYFATLASFGPLSATYFAVYEQLKAQLLATRYGSSIPSAGFWACGGLAGGIAAWVTSPLDLVKLRMQIHGTTFNYGGMLDGLVQVVRNEGIFSLWRGATPRVGFVAATSSVSMALFEWFKILFNS